MNTKKSTDMYYHSITLLENNIILSDKNYAIRTLFGILCKYLEYEIYPIALYTPSGSLLFATDKFTKSIPPKVIDVHSESAPAYHIVISKVMPEKDSNLLVHIFTEILKVWQNIQQTQNLIFRGFDALPNQICVYDKKFHFIYGNVSFFDYIHVKDKQTALGRPVEDVLKDYGTTITAIKKTYDGLKACEVIKTGLPFIDWEVEITSVDQPDHRVLASNDIYPIFDSDGKIEGAVEISRSRNKKLKQLSDELGCNAVYNFDDILGNSSLMRETKQTAMSFATSPFSVLIYGESGVGKELFAQAIHNYSPRRNSPFVAINCASIPPELMNSELFGYDSGSFTGASRKGHIGKFELADGGTLFLDEIAELPLSSQASLLRTLENHEITRIGGSRNIPVDVRIIAATNRPLEKMIKEGSFRRDLYYRLMILNLTISPVRNHPEDILIYCNFFLHLAAQTNDQPDKKLSADAVAIANEYHWPGNIREIRNAMSRVFVLSDSNEISGELLCESLQYYPPTGIHNTPTISNPQSRLATKWDAISRAYADLIEEALDITCGNKTEAAKLLGVSRKTLYNMMKRIPNILNNTSAT